MNKIKVGLCQLKVYSDKAEGLLNAERRIRFAKKRGAEIIVLPEMWNCPYVSSNFRKYAETIPDGTACMMLSRLARELKVYIVGGSIPEKSNGRIYNSSPVFDPKGELVALHRKVHLFDVRLKGVVMCESDVLSPGNTPTVFNTPFGNLGLMVCYDARFPEMFRMMLESNVKGVIIPGAFSTVTGEAHWNALMKIRAVDNQVYVMAVSPSRDPHSSYKAYGHSMIVDPWGTIVEEAGVEEAVVTGMLLKTRIKEVRDRLPLLKHRRKDLY